MKTVVCSHGFGVDATGRGMFTDIAAAFPQFKFVMFGYNTFDEGGNMTVRPLSEQAGILNEQLAKTEGSTTLLCHSMGSVVAVLCDLANVTKVIMLAPPDNLELERFLPIFIDRPGAVYDRGGMSSFPRRDGTTTRIGKEFLASLEKVDVLKLFATIAAKLPTTIVRATEDEITGPTDFPGVKARVMTIAGNHDFSGPARSGLIETLAALLD